MPGDPTIPDPPAASSTRNEPCLGEEPLRPPSLVQLHQDFQDLDEDGRTAALARIEKRYVARIAEYRELANASVENYHDNRARHVHWRKRIVILTGILAIANLAIAYASGLDYTSIRNGGAREVIKWTLTAGLPLAAAAFAATIAIISNLENLYKFPDRAQGFRDAREVLLDASYELEKRWMVEVAPFGNRPEALLRAAVLLDESVRRDRQVRGEIKELTRPPRAGTVAGAN